MLSMVTSPIDSVVIATTKGKHVKRPRQRGVLTHRLHRSLPGQTCFFRSNHRVSAVYSSDFTMADSIRERQNVFSSSLLPGDRTLIAAASPSPSLLLPRGPTFVFRNVADEHQTTLRVRATCDSRKPQSCLQRGRAGYSVLHTDWTFTLLQG